MIPRPARSVRRALPALACCAGLLATLSPAGSQTAPAGTAGRSAAAVPAASAASRDPALLAIAETICTELLGGDQSRHQLNSYQLAALVALDPRDDKGQSRFSFFRNGNVYCRDKGMAVWATFTVDQRLPPRQIVALQTPPVAVLDVRFIRVAPPSPAQEPDRLKAASQAAAGALTGRTDGAAQDLNGGYGLGPAADAPGPSPMAAPGGPQPIIPSSLGTVAGNPGVAARDGVNSR